MTLSARPTAAMKFLQAVPSATWSIVHNLVGYPILDVYVDAGDGTVQKMLPKGLTYIDENTCEVSFSTARSGFATVIV